MERRVFLYGLLVSLTALPATAAETRQRPAARSSSAKPSVAERANRRVGRTTETQTAGKVRKKTTKADAAMNRMVGRKTR